MGRGGQLGFIKEKSRTSLFWPWQLLNQIGKSTCTCVNYKHRNQSMAGLLLSEPGPPLALPTDPKTGLWMHTLSWRPSLWGGLVKVVVVGSPESVIGLHVCSVYFIDTLNPKPISLSQAAMIKKSLKYPSLGRKTDTNCGYWNYISSFLECEAAVTSDSIYLGPSK